MSGTPRTRVCLTCRTLFDDKEDCRGKGHHTVNVRARKGREALADEVWGPDSRARALRQAAKAGAGGAGVGGLLDGCGGSFSPFDACDGMGSASEGIVGVLIAVLVVIVAAILGAILFFIFRALYRWLREKLRRPVATGAPTAAPKPRKKGIAGRGTVRAGKLLDTPWREGSAYGYAMELHEKRVLGGGAMMRDARTAGFELAMDDGRIVRVPEGRIRVLSPVTRTDSEEKKVEQFVESIDGARANEPTVFPFDFVRAVTIEDGDRVELLGELEIAQTGEASGYRENANVMQPVGVPYLRVTKATGVRVAQLSRKELIEEAQTAEAGVPPGEIANEEDSPESIARRNER